MLRDRDAEEHQLGRPTIPWNEQVANLRYDVKCPKCGTIRNLSYNGFSNVRRKLRKGYAVWCKKCARNNRVVYHGE